MTKEIQLTQGKVALVDDEDYDWLSRWKWSLHHGYATRHSLVSDERGGSYPTHRVIMSPIEASDRVDHINGNPLDNRRNNLRVCSHMQNCRNQKLRSDSKTGYKGVDFHKISGKYRARIRVAGKEISLGYYRDALDAALAYDAGAKKHYGEFARLNFQEVDK